MSITFLALLLVPLLFSQETADYQKLYKDGQALLNSGRYAEAVALFEQCVQIRPQSSNDYVPYYYLGTAYYKLNDLAKAKDLLLKEKEQGFISYLPIYSQQLQNILGAIAKKQPAQAETQPQPQPKAEPQGPARIQVQDEAEAGGGIDRERAREIKERERNKLIAGEAKSEPSNVPASPASGVLKVVSEPGANIYIDDRYRDQTDEQGERRISLSPGNHRIEVTKEGFQKRTEPLVATIAVGQETELILSLSRTESPKAIPENRVEKAGDASGGGEQVAGVFYDPRVVAELRKGKESVWNWLKFVAFSAIALLFVLTYIVYRKRFAAQPGISLAPAGPTLNPTSKASVFLDKSGASEGKDWGDYRLLKLIKKTSMSSIFLAKHRDKKEHYAVKVPHEEKIKDEAFRRRFLSEASLSSKLLHENIIEIYDVGEKGTTPYFVMEYFEGRSLRDVLQEKGALVEKLVIEILTKVCQALYYAHNLNPPIIHKDIKPENILLKFKSDKVEELKIIDFGISGDFTRTVSGTPPYISREQILGESLDGRADIFSLGVLAFEMLTGRKLFEPRGFEEATQILTETRAPFILPGQLNPDLTRILGRMLQKRKEDRYRSIEEILKELRTYKFKYLHKEVK